MMKVTKHKGKKWKIFKKGKRIYVHGLKELISSKYPNFTNSLQSQYDPNQNTEDIILRFQKRIPQTKHKSIRYL